MLKVRWDPKAATVNVGDILAEPYQIAQILFKSLVGLGCRV